MSEKSIEAEQGVLTESVIVDSGIIGVGEDVHPITNDELADAFVDAFDQKEKAKGNSDEAGEQGEKATSSADGFSRIVDALMSGDKELTPEMVLGSIVQDERDESEESDESTQAIAEDDEVFNAILADALGLDALPVAGVQEQKEVQPPAAPVQQPAQVQNPAAPERPTLDRDALKQYVAAHQAEMNGTARMSAPEQTSQPEGEEDVVTAQETMKDIEDGDTYTAADGKKWKYTVVDFSIVPEDVKDDMADDIGAEEPNLDEPAAAQDAAPYKYSTPAPSIPGHSIAETSARKKATQTHRRNVAATWEDCKAKEKAKCPYHGAAYMTDQIKKVLMARGLPLGKFAIVAIDPENVADKGSPSLRRYKMVFSQPEDLSDEDSNAVVKDFFASMPNVMFNDRDDEFGDSGNPIKTFHERNFELADEFEDAGDIPLDAPTAEEENARRDTPQEAQHYIRTRQRGYDWGYRDDPELFLTDYLNMLSEKPSNIVACNDDMMRYATQFPEALPPGITLDQVKGTYEKFKKANDLHKGLSAFILNGEVVPEADALAEAASLGKEKEDKEYRKAASDVYDLASQVFGGVQEALATKLRAIQGEIPKLPSSLAINSRDELHHTRYLGKDFSCSKNQFPTNQSGPLWDSLRGLQKTYETQYRNMKQLDMFQQGCEQRDPIRAYFGLLAFQKSIRDLKDTANKIGEIQDTFLTAKGPAWAEKHGFKPKKTKTATKENPERTQGTPKSEAKPKVATTPKAQKPDKTTESVPGGYELDDTIEAEIKEAAKNNKNLISIDAQLKQIGQKYGINSPEFKTFYDKGKRAFQDFFDTERAKRYGEKDKKAQTKGSSEGKTKKAEATTAAKPAKKAEKKPKAQKRDRKPDYAKQFQDISKKSGTSLNGMSLSELFDSGYGVFKDAQSNEFLGRKLPDGKIDTTKPYYVMTAVHKAFGDGMDIKKFTNILKFQEKTVAEKKSKEAEQTDWYDEIFGVS